MFEKFTVEIICPEQTVIKTSASEVIIPSFEGEMGILKNHVSLITFLRPGIIKIISENNKEFYVEEGTVEFNSNNLLILTSTVKEIANIKKDYLNKLIMDAEKKMRRDEISDKEKYLLYYKIETLKNINQ